MEDPREELLNLLKAYEDAWNTHKAGSVAVFFSRDADMVMGKPPEGDWAKCY